MTIIGALEDRSAFALQCPGSNVNHTRLFGVEDYVIHHIIVSLANTNETPPGFAAILGLINLARACAEQNSRRVRRVSGESTNIAAVRTNRDPRLAWT